MMEIVKAKAYKCPIEGDHMVAMTCFPDDDERRHTFFFQCINQQAAEALESAINQQQDRQ